jgi:hypothetical protein
MTAADYDDVHRMAAIEGGVFHVKSTGAYATHGSVCGLL